MRRIIFGLLTGLVCNALLVAWQPHCRAEDKSVAIFGHRQGEAIFLSAKLTNALDVTVTLTCDLENLEPSLPMPITAESNGKAEVPLVTLHVIDRAKPYKSTGTECWSMPAIA